MSFIDKWNWRHNDWTIYSPKTNIVYEINTFDDGNGEYEKYPNIWYIYGNWRDKIALVNKTDNNIQIGSISSWKVNVLSENP